MKSTLNIPAELLTSIDMINTLSGGIAEASIRFQQFESLRQINIRIPSIEVENIKIDVRNNVLIIYYFIPLLSQNQAHHYPKVIYSKSIPYFVDASLISAAVEENEVVVRLPFNELSGGYARTVTISK